LRELFDALAGHQLLGEPVVGPALAEARDRLAVERVALELAPLLGLADETGDPGRPDQPGWFPLLAHGVQGRRRATVGGSRTAGREPPMFEESAVEIAESVRRGERSAVEVVEVALAAIEATDGDLNAWVRLDPDGARAAAAAIDEAVARGEDPGPFAGVPSGVKDL